MKIDEAGLSRKSQEGRNQICFVESWVWHNIWPIGDAESTVADKCRKQYVASKYIRTLWTFYLQSTWLIEVQEKKWSRLCHCHFKVPWPRVIQVSHSSIACASSFYLGLAPEAESENLHFPLSLFCHGRFLCQTFHSSFMAARYFSREMIGKQPLPQCRKNANITPRFKCLQGDPQMK